MVSLGQLPVLFFFWPLYHQVSIFCQLPFKSSDSTQDLPKIGRPKQKWQDNVFRDLQMLEVKDGEQAALHRPRWRDIIAEEKAVVPSHLLDRVLSTTMETRLWC